MAFSGLFFVLAFLPAFLVVYRCSGRSAETGNRILLVFSLIFYAFGGIRYLVLILLMTFAGWLAAKRIEAQKKEGGGRGLLVLTCVLFLAVLGLFKYSSFITETLDRIPGVNFPAAEQALPLGISFYTFKLISYAADVYHERVPAEKNFAKLLLYTVCFHHVMQGPIVRYGDVEPQMEERTISGVGLARGIYRFCVGLGKKVILADPCGELADVLLPVTAEVSGMPVLSLWLGSVFYSLQMYLDFSAYCDMALGLGRMCGFRYAENFDYPYMAVSVRDFWRRWHITLSQFFRDYVYIPLGGSRVGTGRLILNLLAVWALTGIWHGSSWNFLLWGLYYFVFVFIEQMAKKKGIKPGPSWLGHIYAVLVFNFGWVLFRFSDFSQLAFAVRGMCGGSGAGLSSPQLVLTFRNNIFFLLYAVLACTPVFRDLEGLLRTGLEKRKKPLTLLYSLKTAAALVIFALSVLKMAGSTYTPFLYNQF